jgi:hypothetical protein
MIQKIREELAAYLASKSVPVTVELNEPVGGSKMQSTFGRSRITLDHETDRKGDAFLPSRSQRLANQHRYTRSQAWILRIYAQSGRAGALRFEHERLANDILDFVLVGLDEIAAKRSNRWTPNGGSFVTIADLAESERPGGAVYELSLSFDRGVSEAVTWPAPDEPTATLIAGQLTSKTNVTSANADPDLPAPTPEVSCGG